MEAEAAARPVIVGYGMRTVVRPWFVQALFLCVLLFCLSRAVGVYQAAALPATNPRLAHTQTPVVKAPAVPTHQVAAAASGSAVAPTPSAHTVIPPLPACVRDTYTGPATLDLSAAPTGLTTVLAPLHTYNVYGYTASQVRAQLAACAPRLNSGAQEFAGWTAYRLSWYYSYIGTGSSGQCSLNNVKIGLHVGVVEPNLVITRYTSASLASQWRGFIPALNTHENGHVALDRQYAAQLAAELQNMGSVSCGSIDQTVQATISRYVANLNAANDGYDATTNHGATQGAILP